MSELRVILRGLLQKPAFAIVSVLTLTFGIGANTSILSVVEGVLLRELPYRDPGRLVSIGERSEIPGVRNIGFLTSLDWKTRTHSFESMAVYRTVDMALSGAGSAEQLRILQGSGDFWTTLGVEPQLGRVWTAEEAGPTADRVLLLTYGLWQRRFGASPDIIGKDIILNEVPYQVIGILPAAFRAYFAESGAENPITAYSPLRYNAGFRDACRTCRHLRAIARVRSGVTFEKAATDLAVAHDAMMKEFPSDYKASRPSVLVPLHDSIVDSARRPISVIFAAAGILLVATCLNVSMLMLIRANARQNELAIRAALGAGGLRLVRQCILESLSLSIAGGTFGIILAKWMLPVLIRLAPSGIPRIDEIRIDLTVLAASVALTLLSGLAAALIPCCQILKRLAFLDLKPGNRWIIGAESGRVRRQLITAGLACTFALLVAVGLLVKSFDRLIRVDVGFRTQNLVVMNLNSVGPRYPKPEDDIRFFERVVESVKGVPGIRAAAVTSVLPISGNYDMASFEVLGQTYAPDSVLSADRYVVSSGYLDLMGIPVIRGRGFSEHDGADSPKVALISATAARRFFGSEDPIGRQVRAGDEVRSIVGIAGDVHQYRLDLTPTAQFYVPLSQQSRGYMTLIVKTDRGRLETIDAVTRAVAAIDSTRALSRIAAMDELVSESVAPSRFVVSLVGGYGALALFLAVIGIYGAISFAVTTRQREIGIRMALGAQRSQISSMFLRHVLSFAIPALAFGIVMVAAGAPLMRGVLFEVAALDPLVVGIAAVGLLGIVTSASLSPIRRATRVDPNVALREN